MKVGSIRRYVKKDNKFERVTIFDFKSVGESSIKLPKPIIKEHDGIKVVRDDLLDGGTKRRHSMYLLNLFLMFKNGFMLTKRRIWHNYH